MDYWILYWFHSINLSMVKLWEKYDPINYFLNPNKYEN
jgi:hypothetical protein